MTSTVKFTYDRKQIKNIKVGEDAVVFGTCLYVGAAAFIIEFQGSHLV